MAKNKRPWLFQNLETGKKQLVTLDESKGKDGKKKIVVKKVKPGNSNN